MKKRAAEFFAGIGLVRMALERAGWNVVFANDIDPGKFEIYRENFGSNHFILGDIHQLAPASIPDVELATASFPCIDLSLAGNRAGLNGRHSSAYWGFHRIIEEMGKRRPRALLLENVVGLLTSRGGSDLRLIISSLNDLGYFCDLLLVDAAHFVPQSRPRLFIFGSRIVGNQQLLQEPHPSRPGSVIEFVRRHQALKWAIVPLPALPASRPRLDDIVERLASDHPAWWNTERQNHLHRQMSPLHKRTLEQLTRLKRLTFATVYKRIRPAGCRAEVRADGVAGCLRTPRGGSSKQFLIQAGYGAWRVRNMTAREYARLQGVPDSFQINVPYNQALFGFGDAVCIPAVEWVVRSCMGFAKTHRAGAA